MMIVVLIVSYFDNFSSLFLNISHLRAFLGLTPDNLLLNRAEGNHV